MVIRTTNYNLYQWDPSDEKRETIDQMAGNARMIDEALTGLDNRIKTNDTDISGIQKDIDILQGELRELSGDIEEVRNDLYSFSTIESWKDIPLSDVVAAYGSGFISPSYRKDPYGMVTIRGMIKFNTSGTPSGDVDLGTLPSGYRPTATMVTIGWGSLVGGTESSIRINVRSDGRIQARTGDTGAIYISLDSIPPFEGV